VTKKDGRSTTAKSTQSALPESKIEQSSVSKTEVSVSAVKIDLKGIGEAAPHAENMFKSMLKALTTGIGSWYSPIARVREAKADRAIASERADTILDLTRKQAELEELQRKLGWDSSSLGGRAMARLAEDMLRTQASREQVAQSAVQYLIDNPPKQDAPIEISDDWLIQFWNIAEKIGAPEIQIFFAQILARNVESPGFCSPITLQVLSTLTPEVANRFNHFCRLSIRSEQEVYVIHPATFTFQNIGPLDNFGVSYDDLFEFESYRLIRSAETIMTQHVADPPDTITPVDYAGRQAGISFNNLQVHRIIFTRAGAEIRNSLLLSPIPEYTQALVSRFPKAFHPPSV